MNRRDFIKHSALATAAMLTINEFESTALNLKGDADRMPVLFIGHGSPMNAIEQNEFTTTWKKMGVGIPRPKAILCVSAHWMTKGTFVTAMEKPKTIHDFGGFPQALFDVQYPAPGSVEFATATVNMVPGAVVKPSHDWGLDHGCWSVLLPMFPKADIPVYQLSLDLSKPPSFHFELGKQLKKLREMGVLIVGSGNIVHNLGMMEWNDKAFGWAEEFDLWSKERIEAGDDNALVEYEKKGRIATLAVPTNEHYLPLLYSLGLKEKSEPIQFFNEKTIMGSISMRSLKIGG